MDPVSYLTVLRRRWPILLVTAALAVAVAVLVTARTSGSQRVKWEATTQLISEDSTASQLGGGNTGVTNVDTLAAIVELPDTAENVATAIGFEGDPELLLQLIETEPDSQTGILSITATARTADRAKTVADAFAKQAMLFVDAGHRAEINEQIGDAQEQLDAVQKRIDGVNKQIDNTPEDDRGALDALNQQLGRLQADEDRLQDDLTQLNNQLDDQTVNVIQEAIAVPQKSGPLSRGAVVVLAGFLGLLGGALIALVIESVDSRIRTKQQAERHFAAPVLAEIPKISALKRGENAVALIKQPTSPQAEAYRLLRAGLAHPAAADGEGSRAKDGNPRTFLVTSPGPGEGKSTVAANLGVAFSELGRKVVIVSCDFHRPRVHKLFGIPNERGLSEALRSSRARSLDGYARLVTDEPHEVRVVPSGPFSGNPAELLASDKMRELLGKAREEWDVVILDTAPLLAATDATHLLDQVDAVLVVGRAGRTTGDQAERARELLDRLGASTIGVALTGVSEGGSYTRRYAWYLESSNGNKKGDRGFPRLARHSEEE